MLEPRSSSGAPTRRNSRSSQTAENTAEATCSDGQALPEASSPLISAISGYCAQSIRLAGTAVGHSQKVIRQDRQRAPIQTPNSSRERRLLNKAGGSET